MGVSSEQLTSLLDRHWGPLLAWVGIQNPAAEDVVQQAFISLASQSSVPDHPVAWLYQTSRRLAINESTQAARRRRRHAVVARSESLSPNAWKSTEAAELVEKLSQLDEAQRQVIVARLWGDLSFEDIAAVTGSSRATVWRRYQSGLQSLQQLYGVTCESTKPSPANPTTMS